MIAESLAMVCERERVDGRVMFRDNVFLLTEDIDSKGLPHLSADTTLAPLNKIPQIIILIKGGNDFLGPTD